MYVEYYAIENLLINYIIISITSIITRNDNSKNKRWIGATLGMIYSLLYILPNKELLFIFPIKVLVILFISMITFKYENLKEYLRILILFYFVNISIAGSSFFIIYFTGIKHMTISFIILISYLSGIILKYLYNDLKELKYINSMKKDIKICINKIEIELKALLDTGNLLKDPITKDEVIIINVNKLYEILPQEFQKLDLKDINLSIIYDFIDKLDQDISKRIRIIPVRQINDQNLLIGIKSDYIQIDGHTISNVILGLSNFKEDGYSAILNPQILMNI